MRVCLLLIALVLPSCATLMSGFSDSVSFDSRPEGARVCVDQVVVGRTPCQAKVWRAWGKGHVTMTIHGVTQETDVPRTLNPWYIGNVFFGGLIGLLLVDLPTGNCRWTPPGTTVFVDFAAPPDKAVSFVQPWLDQPQTLFGWP